jgi:hypothetical protein
MCLNWRKAAAFLGALILLYLVVDLTRAFSVSLRLGHDRRTRERFKQRIAQAKTVSAALDLQ